MQEKRNHSPLKLYAMRTDALEAQELFEKAWRCIPAFRREKAAKYRMAGDRRRSVAAGLLLVHVLSEAGVSPMSFGSDRTSLEREPGGDTSQRSFPGGPSGRCASESVNFKTSGVSPQTMEDLHLLEGEYGKPYIQVNDERQIIHFNLSHSGSWAICSTGPVENGCDVEQIREKTAGIAEHFFPEEEQKWINQGNTDEMRRQRFTRLWTLRESYIKATGRGMYEDLKSFLIRPEEGQVLLFSSENHVGGLKRNLVPADYYFKEYEIEEGYCCAACSMEDAFEDQIHIVTAQSVAERYSDK